MSIAPFIRPIQTQGGTFYTFSSAAEDLNLTFNSSGKKFSFSKYALLNLPNFQRPTSDAPNEQNYIQLDTIPGAYQYVTTSKTYNAMFAESLQNYVLNLETMVTSTSTYNPDALLTVSERIFFKWLKEIGAIRFDEASTYESALTSGLRYTEEGVSTSYSKVVQYVGEIDMVNSIRSTADAYSEVYINVPTSHGATPLVLFKSTYDENYYSDLNLVNAPTDPVNTEYLYGRTTTQYNPAGLERFAYFDSDFQSYGATAGLAEEYLPALTSPGEYQLMKYDSSTSSYFVDWWFPYPEANSYWTQPAATSGTYDDWTNDSFKIKGVKQGTVDESEVTFKRSRLDGIGIDFNVDNYAPIANNPALSSFADFNSIGESVSFEFNTVLVYYDTVDTSTGNTETNLFGVLFLDNVKDGLTNGSYIPRLSKYKPNRVTGLNGNSFGFKINLKFDTNSEQAAIVTAVNEYSNFSMHVFLDALNRLQTATDLMTTNQEALIAMQENFESLQETVTSLTTTDDITERLDNIDTQLEAANLMFDNSEEIMTLISRNYQEIRNIYNNLTSVQMSYDIDVLKQGEGVLLDKSVADQVTISNDTPSYNVSSTPMLNILEDFTATSSAWTDIIELRKFNNYVKISNEVTTPFDRDVIIYINDSYVNWKTGQSYKIVIDKDWPMDMYTVGSYNLIVYTDAPGRYVNVPYSLEIGRLESLDFENASSTLTLEIICLDAKSYTFTYDIKY